MPKFITRVPRYINGVYIAASPDHPVELDLPEGTKPDAHLIPVDSPRAQEKLKPHFVPKESSHAQQMKDVQSTPLDEQKKGKDGKPGRASDREV